MTANPSADVATRDNAEGCQVRFYIGSGTAIAERDAAEIGGLVPSLKTREVKCVDRSNRPGTVGAARGATQEVQAPMHFQPNDGGRATAGFIGQVGDCVSRAIAIALDLPYKTVYDELAARMAETGKARSARNGIPRKVYEDYLGAHDWRWFPMMRIGSGCTVHLRADELPEGRIIARLSKHMCAVIDGVIHDTHDPSRDGTRCVYGYFKHEVIR